MDSGFGEVFLALDETSNELVAIKKTKIIATPDEVMKESRILKECKSKFIVRYFDVVKQTNEFWVSGSRMT